jgi:Cd2+/Zn2+-exporting ATPase
MTKVTTNCSSNNSCKGPINIHKNDESLGEIVESSFNHQHQYQEVHQELKKCCTPLHTVIDIEPTTMHACVSAEKREFGGFCKSYMKECCSKNGHFATSHFELPSSINKN